MMPIHFGLNRVKIYVSGTKLDIAKYAECREELLSSATWRIGGEVSQAYHHSLLHILSEQC